MGPNTDFKISFWGVGRCKKKKYSGISKLIYSLLPLLLSKMLAEISQVYLAFSSYTSDYWLGKK
jgi:hypothetical protein